MSESPAPPAKSPDRLPTRPGIEAHRPAADDVGPIHLPDRDLPVRVLPKDIGRAAAKVARSDGLPSRPGIGAHGPARNHVGSVHSPDRGLAVCVLPKDVGLVSHLEHRAVAASAAGLCRSEQVAVGVVDQASRWIRAVGVVEADQRGGRARVAGRRLGDLEHRPKAGSAAIRRCSEQVAIGVGDQASLGVRTVGAVEGSIFLGAEPQFRREAGRRAFRSPALLRRGPRAQRVSADKTLTLSELRV
jgi:hypothetical protein